MPSAEPAPAQRADKWLHHVRVFKTRALATQACQKGQVTLGGQTVKAARDLRAGDVLEVERGDLRPQSLRVTEFCENLTPEEWIRRAAELRRQRELETPRAHEVVARPNKQQLRQLREWRESNAGA